MSEHLLPPIYRKKGLMTPHYAPDITYRSPLLPNVLEPESKMLVRPRGAYSIFIGFTKAGTPYYWDPEVLMNPLIVIIGTPGAGKSVTIKSMIIRMKKKGLKFPIIIVDPEGEYEEVIEELRDLNLKTINLEIGTKHYINIFDRPYETMHYELWVRRVVIPGILKALKVTETQAPLMTRVLEDAIFKVYAARGFKPYDPSTWSKEDPTLLDVVRELEADVRAYEEGRVKRGGRIYQTKLYLVERLKKWTTGKGSDFLAHKSTISLRNLLTYDIVVFDIKKLPEEGKNLFNYFVFNYFYSLMEMSKSLVRVGIRIFLVFDEGWILLKVRRGEESELEQLFRRARKYGFAAVIATQKYKEVSETVLPLAGTVFILNIRDAQAVDKLKRTLSIPDRIANQIPVLATGEAVVSCAWRERDFENSKVPFIVRVESELKKMIVLRYRVKVSPEEVFRTIISAEAY